MQKLSLIVLVFLVSGCSGPLFILPGGALKGPVADSAWPARAVDGVIQLETNPAAPYSVNLGYRLIDGKLYIDPAAERRWYQYIAGDARVRIRFDGETEIYAARAVPESDDAVLAQFESDRIVLRLDPDAARL